MTLGFTGEHTLKVDSKGRMSVPADFRRVLEAGDPDWTTGLQVGLYVIYGDHLKDSLHVYCQRIPQDNGRNRRDAKR